MLSRRELLKTAASVVPAIGIGLSIAPESKAAPLTSYGDENFCRHRFKTVQEFCNWSAAPGGGALDSDKLCAQFSFSDCLTQNKLNHGDHRYLVSFDFFELRGGEMAGEFRAKTSRGLVALGFTHGVSRSYSSAIRAMIRDFSRYKRRNLFTSHIVDRPFWIPGGIVTDKAIAYQTDSAGPHWKFNRDGTYYFCKGTEA